THGVGLADLVPGLVAVDRIGERLLACRNLAVEDVGLACDHPVDRLLAGREGLRFADALPGDLSAPGVAAARDGAHSLGSPLFDCLWRNSRRSVAAGRCRCRGESVGFCGFWRRG